MVNNLSIRHIDPFVVYLVRDLYYLYSPNNHTHTSNRVFKDFKESYLFSDEELVAYLQKPLIHCTEAELKLLMVLVCARLRVESLFSKNGYMCREYLTLQDVNTVIQCFLERLGNSYPEPDTVFDFTNHKEILSKVNSHNSIDVVKTLILPTLTSNFMAVENTYKTSDFRGYFNKQERTYPELGPYLHKTGGEGSVYASRMDIFKRPFRSPADFPIIMKDKFVTLRVRDLIYGHNLTSRGRWLRRVKELKECNTDLTDEWLVNLFLKPLSEVTKKELFDLERILSMYEIWNIQLNQFRHNLRLARFQEVNKIYNEHTAEDCKSRLSKTRPINYHKLYNI